MTFSPLTNWTIPHHGRYNIRQFKISGFTIHHNAGVNSWGEASNPNREASATYWISNEGEIIGNIPEEYRPWTTGSAGYPEGALSDHRNITVEVSNTPEGTRNGTWAISNAAYNALCRLIADVFKRYGLGTVRRATYGGVAVHQDFVPTACPGPYIMARLDNIIAEANRINGGGGGKPTPTPKPNPGGKTVDQVAKEILYSKDYGGWGTGSTRVQRLTNAGYNANAVQARINALLGGGGSAPAPAKKSVDAVAREILYSPNYGGWGTGADRVSKLTKAGYNANTVQSIINQLLNGGKTSSNSKSVDTVAREIAFAPNYGGWGTGADRVSKLTKAGYNANAVQARINQLV